MKRWGWWIPIPVTLAMTLFILMTLVVCVIFQEVLTSKVLDNGFWTRYDGVSICTQKVRPTRGSS